MYMEEEEMVIQDLLIMTIGKVVALVVQVVLLVGVMVLIKVVQHK